MQGSRPVKSVGLELVPLAMHPARVLVRVQADRTVAAEPVQGFRAARPHPPAISQIGLNVSWSKKVELHVAASDRGQAGEFRGL